MFLRRLKAILVNATVWAVAWTTAGAVFAALLALRASTGDLPLPFLQILANLMVSVTAVAACTGFIGGGLFAVGLMVAERDRSVDELSRKRAAILGMLGGLAIPLLLYVRIELYTRASVPLLDGLLLLGGAAAFGAISATAALAAAQRGKQLSAGTESNLLDDGITSATRHGCE